jgi:beta-glucosidase
MSGDDLTEKEGGDTANIDLPPQQVELVNAVTDLGKSTVAVVSFAHPAVVSFAHPQGLASVIDRVPAVLRLLRWMAPKGPRSPTPSSGVTTPGGGVEYTVGLSVGVESGRQSWHAQQARVTGSSPVPPL